MQAQQMKAENKDKWKYDSVKLHKVLFQVVKQVFPLQNHNPDMKPLDLLVPIE